MHADELAGHLPGPWGWALAKGRGHGRRAQPEDLERLAALRHLRGGPFGGGRMFGGPPFGGGRGRKRRGDARIALLLLLAEEPRNGYQLMQTIEERSGGYWRPSPGSVYPALAQLEDEGLIRATERDGTRLFEITEAGREQVAKRGDEPAPWELDGTAQDEASTDLRSLMGQVAVAAMQVGQAGDEQQAARAGEILVETRRALYRILAEESDG